MSPVLHQLAILLQITSLQGLAVVLLLGPGVLLYELTRKYVPWDPEDRLIVAVLGGALSGYAAFWIVFASPQAGFAFSLAIAALAAWGVLRHLRARDHENPGTLVLPAALLLLGTLVVYNGFVMSRSPSGSPEAATTVTGWDLPVDNMLPFSVAERMYEGIDAREVAGWRSSDRPPLQSGYWLLMKPVFRPLGSAEQGYYAVATALQALWVIALVVLARTCADGNLQFGVAFLFVLFSGFTLVNTVFTWPKLLGAAFSVVALVLLALRSATSKDVLLAGAATGFAMLSHGGSAFPFIVLLPWWFFGRDGWRPRRLALFALPILFLVLPWNFYQAIYDPPGNRLVKMHLAGVDQVDARSSLEAIVDAYRFTPWETLVRTKTFNLEMGYSNASLRDWAYFALPALRRGQFYALFHALGILNLGFVLIAVALARRALGTHWPRDLTPYFKLIGFSLAVWVAWCMLMFPWASAVLHQGSYVVPLLLLYSLARVLHGFFGTLVFVALTIHTALFCIIWGDVAASQAAVGGFAWVLAALLAASLMTLRLLADPTSGQDQVRSPER